MTPPPDLGPNGRPLDAPEGGKSGGGVNDGTPPLDHTSILQQLGSLKQGMEMKLARATTSGEVELIRVEYLGRQGELQKFWQILPQIQPDERPQVGQQLNAAKEQLTRELEAKRTEVISTSDSGRPIREALDLTLPGHPPLVGHRHPVTQVVEEILTAFEHLGFTVVEGPEIETPFHNFDALNIPSDHPSRESFDTFFLKTDPPGQMLLRSHTSPVQVRYLEAHKAGRRPFRIVVPGRVFRPDALDASHCFQFHQIEGLIVEPGVTFADLKGLLTAFVRAVFGPATRLRFRPHFFPFTEPSAEADISCIFCRGHGCRVCGQKGWLEILGAGMVHPHVFESTGWPEATRGLAFGLGIERIAMLKFGIDDIRLFFDNDVRFLHQF